MIVPVPVSESSTRLLDAFIATVKVSVPSIMASLTVVMVNCCVSPAVPANVSVTGLLSKSSPPIAESSVKLISTVNDVCVALSNDTVKVISSPSVSLTLSTVNVAVSSSKIVPVPVSLSSTKALDDTRLMVKSSSPSSIASSKIATDTVICSPSFPAKVMSADVLL